MECCQTKNEYISFLVEVEEISSEAFVCHNNNATSNYKYLLVDFFFNVVVVGCSFWINERNERRHMYEIRIE